jgi:hypothetical protein
LYYNIISTPAHVLDGKVSFIQQSQADLGYAAPFRKKKKKGNVGNELFAKR